MPRNIIDNIVIQHYNKSSAFSFCEYTNIRFFEVLCFKEGEGSLIVNGSAVRYKSNSIFLFVPDDIYIVEAETITTVTTIKFLKSFFYNKLSHATLPINNWFRKIESILNNESHHLRALEFKDSTENKNLLSLIDILQKEYNRKDFFDALIIQNSLSIILHIIARNIKHLDAVSESHKTNSKIQDIIHYIHSNIYEPELLSNKNLASTFYFSENYLNQYFKKHMGISIKKYMLNYKLKLVETRLKYTDMHLSEIALELGFTDASHLNKTFLSYKNMSISDYKASLSKELT